MQAPTERFSSRVEDYAKYRPSYPDQVVEVLEEHCGLERSHVIADIGSGTGISSELFLRAGQHVLAVEPNREMRDKAESLLSGFEKFESIAASAEATTLPDACANFVVCAQAFHWFHPDAARREFQRILRPRGFVVLIWNERRTDTPLMTGYEDLVLRYSDEYQRTPHCDSVRPEKIVEFFSPNHHERVTLPNEQALDRDALIGRVRSVSFLPPPGHPRFESLISEVQTLFERCQAQGRVQFAYKTQIYFGRLDQEPS